MGTQLILSMKYKQKRDIEQETVDYSEIED